MKNIRIIIGVSIIVFGCLVGIGIQTAWGWDPGAWNAGDATLKISDNSWLTFDYEAQLYGQFSNTGSGSNQTGDTSNIYFRRNRLSMLGHVSDDYGFYVSVEQGAIEGLTMSSSVSYFEPLDAFAYAKFTDYLRVRAGLTKDQLVRENNEECFAPLSMDRSLFVYTDLPRLNRDFGVVVWGNLVDAKLQYRLAVMEGDQTSNNPNSQFRYTGRVHLTLLDPEDSLSYKGTYLGEKKVLTFGAGYQIQPDMVYANLAAETLPKDYTAWTFDEFFEYPIEKVGTFTLSSAYLKEDFGNAYQGGNPDPRSTGVFGQKKGWYAKAGYLLPNKVGPGKLQFYGRYEDWRFAQLSDNVFDQKVKWWAAGVNYLLKGQDLRVTVEYSNTHFGIPDPINPANARSFDTLTTMLQVRF